MPHTSFLRVGIFLFSFQRRAGGEPLAIVRGESGGGRRRLEQGERRRVPDPLICKGPGLELTSTASVNSCDRLVAVRCS
jgi:hypothetical protein